MTELSHIHTAASNVFGPGLSQRARLLTLSTAHGSDLPESLVVERFSAREAVNELFCFDIDALSVSAHLDLTALIGDEITLRLLQPDGTRRAWHGYCTRAHWLGANGGIARYRLRLEPGLAFLRERLDSFLFQDKDVADIAAELLADYPQVRVRFDLVQQLAVRPICTQYRETDLAFLLRLLASEGLNFRFTHQQNEEAAEPDGAANTQARHELVIFDSEARVPQLTGGSVVRFHGVRAADHDDAIDRFSALREVRPNAVALSSWDPDILHATAAEAASALDTGELPLLSVHDGSNVQRFADVTAADRHVRLALTELELGNKRIAGAGSVRRLAAGHVFTLAQHDAYPPGEDAFTVLWVEHEGANNFDVGPAAFGGSSGHLQRGTYRNRFGCVRAGVPLVPEGTAARRRPTAPGPQTALVVGLPDTVLTTQRDHCVKIQFPWQRGANPNRGGVHETGNSTDTTGNAPGDHTSGAWVRVTEALAGPNWGSCFLPRIGTEVLVDFIEGDIDRPLIVAQLYNGVDLPPYSAGVDSGINHAGVISGLHSRTLDGAGYNQWVVDDTRGQLRMRLATSSAASQLNLGYLIAQVPASAQRGAFRGTGFELRTDGWGVLRAAAGMLLTTTSRPVLGPSVTSTQMDAAESVAQLKAALDLTQRVCEAAARQQARTSADANTGLENFIALLDRGQRGKYEGMVNGQDARKTTPGTRDPDAPVERFAEPALLLDTPTTQNWAGPASAVVFAGGQLHWSTQGDVHLTAAHTLSSVAGNASTLFSQRRGIQAIAANGPVSLAAHTDRLEMLAEQGVKVLSVEGHVSIAAKQKIAIIAGQSAVTLEGGNITFTCPGQFAAKGGQRLFMGPASKAGVVEKLPDTRIKPFAEQIRAMNLPTSRS